MVDEKEKTSGTASADVETRGQIRILIVEDSPNINMLYERGLPDTIFEKRFAQNGQEAMTVYKAWRPDIIILDVMLPVMSGYAFLKEIRQTLQDKFTTIIMSTRLSNKDDVTSMAKFGIQGYIVKPFSARDFCLRILKYYEKTDPVRTAEAMTLYNQFQEDTIKAIFNHDMPEKGQDADSDSKNTSKEGAGQQKVKGQETR